MTTIFIDITVVQSGNLLKTLLGLLQRDVFPVTGQLLGFDLVVV